jgi:gluconolactonase
MAWNFETVAGPFKGALGGLAWDGKGMLFTATAEQLLLRYVPEDGSVEEVRRYTNGVNGIALGPEGDIFGCQGLSRRIVRFLPDGSATTTGFTVDGRYHNQPADLCIDSKRRVWFADPFGESISSGPQILPYLDYAAVLRMERNERGLWDIRRMTEDTANPRAVLLSPDETTVYVAESGTRAAEHRELRAYPVLDDRTLGTAVVLAVFGADYRGVHRGIEGMCLDSAGNIVAVGGWRRSGPGPMAAVFSPAGLVLESHALPSDMPMKCGFGGIGLDMLYVTTGEGLLLRARDIGRSGAPPNLFRR